MNRTRCLEVIRFAVEHGGVLSRRAAAAALVDFNENEANALVVRALDDPDPEVQVLAPSLSSHSNGFTATSIDSIPNFAITRVRWSNGLIRTPLGNSSRN
jgi:hypothetical protein